jgi:hypothetical protein
MASLDNTGRYVVSCGDNIPIIRNLLSPSDVLRLERNGHTSQVNSAYFSPDGTSSSPPSRVVTASNDQKAILWFVLEKLPIQQDQSDSLWAIVRPQPQVFSVDMKRVAVGSAKDSSCVVLYNPEQFSIPITKITIRPRGNRTTTPFSIVSGGAPFMLNPKDTARIEFRYAPTVVGRDTADLVFETASAETFISQIIGEGISLSVGILNFDFGNVFVNTPRDTIITAVLRNTGSRTVTLTNPQLGGAPTVFQFLQQPSTTITLQPGATADVRVSFLPNSIGNASAPLSFTISETGQITTATLIGTGIREGALLQALKPVASPASAVCDTASFLVPLTNIGNRDVILESITNASIRAANGALSTEFVITSRFPITIPAGSTNAIVVQFRPQKFGTTQGFLTITSNSLGGNVLVSLVARTERDSLTFSDRFLNLGTVDPQVGTSAVFTVRNIGNTARTVWFDKPTALSAEKSRFTISATPADFLLASGATSQVRITFLGGQAGVTYDDYYVFGPLCPTGVGVSDTVRVSVTVNTRPQLQMISLTQSTTTCASSGTFTVLFTNTGTTTATMLQAGIRAPFNIATPVPAILHPRDTVRVQVGYTLLGSGVLTDSLRISGGTSGTIVATLAVVKADVGFTILPNPRTFPQLEANMPSTTTMTIVNNGSVPLQLAPALAGRTGDAGFTFSPSTDIPPYSAQQVTVSFAGGLGNRNFAAAFPFVQEFPAGMCKKTDTLRVTASTIGRTGELSLTDITGNPGETVQMRVFLRNRKNIPIGTIITDTVRTNVTMLYPQAPTPRGRHEFGERVMPMRWAVRSDDESVPLDTVRFLVLLGNDSLATVRLSGTPENRSAGTLITTAPAGTNVCRTVRVPFTQVGTHVATFCLLHLPYIGGNSFVISSLGTVRIDDLRPQPVVSEMTLDFWSRDAELYVLRVTDALGQEFFPSKEIRSVQGMNTVVITETSILPRGVYFAYLRSARELAARRFMIVR